jgi:GntR family transcriptional regulator
VFDDRSPIYLQIAARIRADIVAGTLGADEQIMSTNQYASFYGINPATAAKAFHELVDEGVLYKRRGVGMFVSPDAAELLRNDGRASFVADVLDPVIDRALALGIPLAELVTHIDGRAGGAAAATTPTDTAGPSGPAPTTPGGPS